MHFRTGHSFPGRGRDPQPHAERLGDSWCLGVLAAISEKQRDSKVKDGLRVKRAKRIDKAVTSLQRDARADSPIDLYRYSRLPVTWMADPFVGSPSRHGQWPGQPGR